MMESSLVDTERELLRRCVRRPAARVLEAGYGRRSSRADSLALPELAADLCSRLPFEDATFDLVYASFVVEHLDDPEAAFREWRRVLRDSAVLVGFETRLGAPALSWPSCTSSRRSTGTPAVEGRSRRCSSGWSGCFPPTGGRRSSPCCGRSLPSRAVPELAVQEPVLKPAGCCGSA